ncbi:MAG: agmatinase [Candidatus Altiarchaeota archaeon]|nr:agmatinase [Candidatus Altiarchaeota archaeon]
MDNKPCFGGLTGDYSSYDRSSIVILPVPFDKTCSWLPGAVKGPEAIILASPNLELYDIETDSEVYPKGIHTSDPVLAETSEEMINGVYGRVRSLLCDGKFVVTLGGEHSVSIGSVKAYQEFFKDLSVLHLDAHMDSRDSYEGDEYSHACTMARIREFIDVVVSVGVRSMDSSELSRVDQNNIFYAHEIHDRSDWIREVVNRLTDNVYVSIDLDVFDPSMMPSAGTPEPGGLDWYQVNDLVKAVSKKRNIVGFDVVELSPIESNKAPDFLAAKLVYRILSERFYKE